MLDSVILIFDQNIRRDGMNTKLEQKSTNDLAVDSKPKKGSAGVAVRTGLAAGGYDDYGSDVVIIETPVDALPILI